MYNKSALYLGEIYDSKFVYFLILEIFGKDSVINGEIKQNCLEFAEQLFKIRLDKQIRSLERQSRFNALVIDHMNEIKKRFQNTI